jgi:outer membrane protein assembly factor BamB
LVFFADGDGIVYAASASTGEILWVYDVLTVPGASVPDCTGAAVYEIAGVEYVTFEFGGSSTVAIAGGQTIKGNALVTFALPPAAAAAAKAKAK